MLTMSTLMMPTTMTTMTNPGPIPAHSVPQQQKLEPPKMQAAPTIAHVTNQNANVNKSGSLREFILFGGPGELFLRSFREITTESH